MEEKLTAQDLEALRRITTPNACNAVESFGVRPANQGFMGPEVRCVFPEMGAMVGFAATLTIAASYPPVRRIKTTDLWEHIQQVPAPRVLVVHDLDYPQPVGALFGDVSSNVYKALGCVGAVTDGGVRDLDEVRGVGFHLFASAVLVSHAYVHVVDFGEPVNVGGLVIRPGDLLHGDKHGVVSIPLETARQVPAAARKQEEWEARIIRACRAPAFDPEKVLEAMRSRPT